MGKFEQNIERSGYLGKSKNPEFFPAKQRSSYIEADEEVLKKELKEDSFAKASMLEFLVDNLVGKLSSPENYKIIDEIMEEEGASQELADKIWRYSEKLGSKRIIPENSAKEIMLNIYNSLLPYIQRMKTKGAEEEWQAVIKEDFINLKEYLDLLDNYSGFEKAELNNKLGFLTGRMDENELLILRGNKGQYIEKCKKALMNQKSR